jgi:hypothetical protein
MNINKEIMEQEAKIFISTLFTLPEVEKLQIKDVFILSVDDNENLMKGLNQCYHDKYSDVDINVYLKLHPADFEAETPIYRKHFSRLELQDKIFGIAFQERVYNKEGMRICLKTGVRIDFTCFCRSDELAPLLTQSPLPLVEHTGVDKNSTTLAKWNLEKADWFWFVAIQALGKLMRKDYLISSHLAHTLLMEGLVVQMLIRDNKYNTNFHRYGYEEKLEYLQVDVIDSKEFKLPEDATHNHIVDLLYKAVISYDNLVPLLNPKYICRSDIFFDIWRSYIK